MIKLHARNFTTTEHTNVLLYRISKSFLVYLCITLACCAFSFAEDSICYETSEKGRIENAVKLPSSGKNFVSYGLIPQLLGRSYVHSLVQQIFIDAYKALEEDQPTKTYKFAESRFDIEMSFSSQNSSWQN